MTQKEKIEMLKGSITYFYEKEGRSLSYIARVLEVDRKTLSNQIEEWELVKADARYLTPSNQKFLNRNRKIILDQLDSDVSISDIAIGLKIDRETLLYTFIESDKELLHHYNLAKERQKKKTETRLQRRMDESRFDFDFEDLEGEEWKPILGYDGYEVSNMGRIKRYFPACKKYQLIQPTVNNYHERMYVKMMHHDGKEKTLNLARIVAHAFVDDYSEEKNTVDYIDGNHFNNRADNLKWVSQTENKHRAFRGEKKNYMPYQKSGKFKCIKLDEKYEFKTIRALARFLGVSDTQAQRYLSGESKSDHTFRFIY